MAFELNQKGPTGIEHRKDRTHTKEQKQRVQRPWGWNELVFKNMEKTDEAGVQGKSGGIRPERQEVHYREKKLAIRFILCKFFPLSFTIISNLKMPCEKHIKNTKGLYQA